MGNAYLQPFPNYDEVPLVSIAILVRSELRVTLLEAITHVPAPTRTGTPNEICNALLVHGIVSFGLKSLL